MSIWGSRKIKEWIANGGLTDCYDGCVNPASVNLRLSENIAIPSKKMNNFITLGEEVLYNNCNYPYGMLLGPGEFVLASTIENVDIPVDAAAFVQGRSSIGRIGLSVQNAGFVDPGFNGQITLELLNESPNVIKLIPGYPIVQIVLMDADDVEEGYNGKYNGQIGATGSRMHLDKVKGYDQE